MPNILNQDEIDSLMGAMEDGKLDEFAEEANSNSKINDYNFMKPNLITKDQLQSFENVHESFSKELSAAIALMLRTNSDVSLVSTEQQQYSEFIGSLAQFSHLVTFKTGEFPGEALFEMNLSLVFGIIDMLLGGEGNVETEIRVPTDIEVSILAPFIEKMLEKLEFCWNTLLDVQLVKLREESNPEYLQAAPNDAPVVVLAFDVKIGNANGIINICYPMPLIQSVNEYLDGVSGQKDTYYGEKANDVTRRRVLNAILDVPIPFSVDLGKTSIAGSDLMRLAPGDVLKFDNKIEELLTLSLAGKPLYKVRPGKIKKEIFIRLNKEITKEKTEDLILNIE